jgi:hypothetical protein
MKPLSLLIILICCFNLSYSQALKTKSSSLSDFNKSLSELAKMEQADNYSLKFDEQLRPYIEIHFLNNLPFKKVITTFLFEFDYEIQGVNYLCNKTIKRIIKPGSQAKINITFDDEELKSYSQPSDIKIDNDKFLFTIKSIRFADGTITVNPILIMAKK